MLDVQRLQDEARNIASNYGDVQSGYSISKMHFSLNGAELDPAKSISVDRWRPLNTGINSNLSVRTFRFPVTHHYFSLPLHLFIQWPTEHEYLI